MTATVDRAGYLRRVIETTVPDAIGRPAIDAARRELVAMTNPNNSEDTTMSTITNTPGVEALVGAVEEAGVRVSRITDATARAAAERNLGQAIRDAVERWEQANPLVTRTALAEGSPAFEMKADETYNNLFGPGTGR